MSDILASMKGGIVVSCQAHEEDALYGPENMALMAKAAEFGGAIGIRADDPNHIAAIRKLTNLPIIGIYKEDVVGYGPRITLNMDRARAIYEAGATIIALDVTDRPHPYGISGIDLMKQIKKEFGCLVMADISTFEEGVAAAAAGADIVASTLSGYTENTVMTPGPDFELVAKLVKALPNTPVICEGRIACPEHARQLLRLGAHCIVVGSMITRPMWITKQYSLAMHSFREERYAYCLDIGGTKIAGGIIDKNGKICLGPIKTSCPQTSAEDVIKACVTLLDELKSKWTSIAPTCIGVSTGGTIDIGGNVVYATPTIPNWKGAPIKTMLQKEYKLPVHVVNDGNAAAFGESLIGNGKGKYSCLGITIGTGLGGGMVVDGKLYMATRDMAQCIGHVLVNRDGRTADGEVEGAFEAYCSGRALCYEYNRLVTKEHQLETGKEVGDLAKQGDKNAVAAAHAVGEWLGIALSSVCACLNPSIVCIGGSVSELGDLILEPARETFKKNAFTPIKETPIVIAALGGDAGLVGAGLLAMEQA
ncbi:hypothetical protein WA158_005495 [Blastocystis sp. Blastoise]